MIGLRKAHTSTTSIISNKTPSCFQVHRPPPRSLLLSRNNLLIVWRTYIVLLKVSAPWAANLACKTRSRGLAEPALFPFTAKCHYSRVNPCLKYLMFIYKFHETISLRTVTILIPQPIEWERWTYMDTQTYILMLPARIITHTKKKERTKAERKGLSASLTSRQDGPGARWCRIFVISVVTLELQLQQPPAQPSHSYGSECLDGECFGMLHLSMSSNHTHHMILSMLFWKIVWNKPCMWCTQGTWRYQQMPFRLFEK